ncbi:MAG: ATP-binding cassette domain-containing protein, partial [Asticcacaulis sp.]
MPISTAELSHTDVAPTPKAARAQLQIWAKSQARPIRLSSLLGLLDSLCIIGFAWGLSHMVTNLFGKPAQLSLVLVPALVTIFSLGVRSVIDILNQRLSLNIARKIISRIRLDLMDAALKGRLDPSSQQGRLNALFEDTEALEGYYARFRQAEVQARLLPLLMIALIAVLSPISGVILGLTLLPFVAMMALLGLSSAGQAKRQLDALSRLSNLFVDRIRALPLILSFESGPRQVKAVERAAGDVAECTLSVLKIAFITSAVLEFFSALSVALIAIYCGFYLLGELPFSVPEHLTLTTAFFVLALSPEVYAPMRRLAAAYHDQQTAIASAQRLMGLKITPEGPAMPAPKQAPVIFYSNVVCTFPDDPNLLIGPVSFTARAGHVIALKGPTGSGKTTLLRLLLGYGHVLSGEILIDGEPLGDMRAGLGWVSQNPPILAGSLRDNLTLANPDASSEQLDKAILDFGLTPVIDSRDQALLSALNERGSGLSGGERRRIGMARAMLKDPPLLLLDEPTADLDSDAEADLMRRLPDLFKGRTVIF